MNRAERRRQERQKKHISQDLQRKILRQTEQQLNDGRVEAMMVCMALGLHRESLVSGKSGCFGPCVRWTS